MGIHQRRFGRTMPFTALDTVHHPDSFWVPRRLYWDADDMVVQLMFIGYHDKASYDRDEGLIAHPPKTYNVGDQTGAYSMALSLMTDGVVKPIGKEFAGALWQIALNTFDTPDPAAPATFRSFFHGSVEANVPPVISDVAPREAAPGGTVVITGSGFTPVYLGQPTTRVFFGQMEAAAVRFTAPGHVEVDLPPGLAPGAYPVALYDIAGQLGYDAAGVTVTG